MQIKFDCTQYTVDTATQSVSHFTGEEIIKEFITNFIFLTNMSSCGTINLHFPVHIIDSDRQLSFIFLNNRIDQTSHVLFVVLTNYLHTS